MLRSNQKEWRRERDSNPRARFRANGFQDRRLKPLGHLSVRDQHEPRTGDPLELVCLDHRYAVHERTQRIRDHH